MTDVIATSQGGLRIARSRPMIAVTSAFKRGSKGLYIDTLHLIDCGDAIEAPGRPPSLKRQKASVYASSITSASSAGPAQVTIPTTSPVKAATRASSSVPSSEQMVVPETPRQSAIPRVESYTSETPPDTSSTRIPPEWVVGRDSPQKPRVRGVNEMSLGRPDRLHRGRSVEHGGPSMSTSPRS